MTAISRAVLITGCSTGIGREIALTMARAGWAVYATARRLEAIADLETAGCRILPLDVTDDASRRAAVDAVVSAHGAVGVLVNNAGIQHLGATETVPLERTKEVFETNVFGALAMTQLVLPGMRAQRWGRIITVGSMNGRYPMPGMGAYGATKHALEAFSDALRYELRPFGVAVSLVQPGMVRTPLAHTAADRPVEAGADPAYAQFEADIVTTARTWESGPMARLGCGPEDVARVVAEAAASRRPRSRYRVAASAHLMLAARKALTDRAFDALLRTQFPSPRPKR